MTPELTTEKISISLPGALLRALDKHLKPNESRSGYFQILTKRDLEEKGVLASAADSSEEQLLPLIREAKAAGLDPLALLQAALSERLAS
jgi:metal-responsive CopG/Arc/MetJ family transcriptional regulator